MVQHTIEYRLEEISSQVHLLPKVQRVRGLWSVRIIGPRLIQSVTHGQLCTVGKRTKVDGGSFRGEARWEEI